MIELSLQVFVLQYYFRVVPFNPLTAAEAALAPAFPSPSLDSRRIERAEWPIQLESDPRHGSPSSSVIPLTESPRTASCKLACDARSTAAHGSVPDHDRNNRFRTRGARHCRNPYFSGSKYFFAIWRLESPMRRSGVFLMNRIATMSRMSTDTSPYERELNRREPGASADDIVMRARPNLRRPCRLHKAVAETPY